MPRMATAHIEAPPGWGPMRVVLATCRRLGYRVDRVARLGSGPDLLRLS